MMNQHEVLAAEVLEKHQAKQLADAYRVECERMLALLGQLKSGAVKLDQLEVGAHGWRVHPAPRMFEDSGSGQDTLERIEATLARVEAALKQPAEDGAEDGEEVTVPSYFEAVDDVEPDECDDEERAS